MKNLFLFAALFLSLPLFAQDDFDGEDFHSGDIEVSSETLDIDADYVKKKDSGADRLRKMRQKLEQRNEMIVKKKIERIRVQRELQLMREIEKSFAEQLKKIDSLK
jgi:hypothetical protein